MVVVDRNRWLGETVACWKARRERALKRWLHGTRKDCDVVLLVGQEVALENKERPVGTTKAAQFLVWVVGAQ